MLLGCSTILYGGHSLERALTGIRDAGYVAIELCSILGMAEHLLPGLPESEYHRLADLIGEHDLFIESIGASGNLLSEEGRVRFVALLEAAPHLGAPAITTGTGGRSDDEESFRRVVAAIRDLIPAAEANGCVISIKPHVNTAVYNTPTSLRFIEEINSPWVRLNVDPSHLYRVDEDPEDSIPQLAPYIKTARIRDTLSREKPIGPVETQIPGGGAMHLNAIAEAFKAVPGLRYVTLEIVGTKNMAAEEVDRVVRRSYDYLYPLFEEGQQR
ncbi:MAG: sugar phosphate isomerase/epimerase [Armatimonadetes bacterium]|nr:sugar phosphate isomerase/epimerase [Armatimonadota bacterium]